MSERVTKIKRKDIDRSLRVAVEEAVRVNRALGISYQKVSGDCVILVKPNGVEINLKKAKFGTVRVKKKHYTLTKK